MDLMALTFWLLTAVGGFYMMAVAARTGNTSSGATESHLPSALIFSHMALALVGLGIWALYMGNNEDALAWSALGTLVIVAALGTVMFVRWQRDRMGTAEEVAERKERLAEQQIPSFVVHFHGAAAFVTIVLVLLAALKVGNSP